LPDTFREVRIVNPKWADRLLIVGLVIVAWGVCSLYLGHLANPWEMIVCILEGNAAVSR